MTNQEKDIYNTFLRISRSSKKQPYRRRENFDNFESNDSYGYIIKLSHFFYKFPHINKTDFFSAPYNIYPDEDCFYDLKFYTSPKAIKLYSTYTKSKDAEKPDNEYNIQFIKQSLLYIFKHCRDNNITVGDYFNHMTGDVHTHILHLRERKISLYTILGIDMCDSACKFSSYSAEKLNFIISNTFTDCLDSSRVNMYNSITAKTVIRVGLDHIKKLLNTKQNTI